MLNLLGKKGNKEINALNPTVNSRKESLVHFKYSGSIFNCDNISYYLNFRNVNKEYFLILDFCLQILKVSYIFIFIFSSKLIFRAFI